MEFRTRQKSQVLDDLVAKLEQMPERHPDRPTLIRMVLDLRREIDRRSAPGSRHRWPDRPYLVILANGPLSPTEDLDTAIIAARQAQALGQSVERIEQGARVVLEGAALSEAIRESDGR